MWKEEVEEGSPSAPLVFIPHSTFRTPHSLRFLMTWAGKCHSVPVTYNIEVRKIRCGETPVCPPCQDSGCLRRPVELAKDSGYISESAARGGRRIGLSLNHLSNTR